MRNKLIIKKYMAQIDEIRKKIATLNESQASIETMSQWLVFHRKNAGISRQNVLIGILIE
jgi:prefoldin subunit 5